MKGLNKKMSMTALSRGPTDLQMVKHNSKPNIHDNAHPQHKCLTKREPPKLIKSAQISAAGMREKMVKSDLL